MMRLTTGCDRHGDHKPGANPAGVRAGPGVFEGGPRTDLGAECGRPVPAGATKNPPSRNSRNRSFLGNVGGFPEKVT